jgi:hypothetical protein
MRTRHLLIATLCAGVPAAGATAQESTAKLWRARQQQQQQAAYRAPTVSPYVNMLRDGMPAVFNYYTLVRPQLEQNQVNHQDRSSIHRLQSEVDRETQVKSAGRAKQTRPSVARKRPRYMDYSGYFGRVPEPDAQPLASIERPAAFAVRRIGE